MHSSRKPLSALWWRFVVTLLVPFAQTHSIFDMLDATERKTLAWCMFLAGLLCLIPGEIPKGPTPLDYMRQVVGRLLDHHATHGAWAIGIVLTAYHLRQSRKEQVEPTLQTQG